MKKLYFNFLFLFFLFFFNSSFAQDSLTLKQQLDRIMEEVKDLNKAVFNKSFDSKNINLDNNEQDVERFTSIDIRMYDLENDVKNLTLQLEEITFKIDDLYNYIKKIEKEINLNLEGLKNNAIADTEALNKNVSNELKVELKVEKEDRLLENILNIYDKIN